MSLTRDVADKLEEKTVNMHRSNVTLATAWVVILVVSALPNIFFLELGRGTLTWLIWTKIGLLILLALVSLG